MTLDLIRRAIGYRLQEQAEGGLPPALRRSLERLGACLDRTTPIPVAHVRIKPGTRLVRDWGGTSHHVVVDDAGFVYREQRYRSLSEIACTITGAKWSGPRFFGLRSAARG